MTLRPFSARAGIGTPLRIGATALAVLACPVALNTGYSYRERVATRAGAAPETVLDYLVRRHRHSDQAIWSARLDRGEVEVRGVRAHRATVVHAHDTLVWHRPPWDEPPVDTRYTVVLEDRTLLAVAKPRGLPTMPAGGYLQHTLLALVRTRWPEASPMHRLGRETSGLVLFARTCSARVALQDAWRRHAVHKTYRALAAGVARCDAYDLDAPIGPVGHPLLGAVHAASASGKPSRSRARVLERRARDTLFEVAIDTGRPHQIRIHLAFAGHPLVGDPLYAVGGLPRDGALPGAGGYFLHAERLAFTHPLSGQTVALRVEPPVELRTHDES
jgi:23S rRNA pseudouridine1911/1915/1917 synthase